MGFVSMLRERKAVAASSASVTAIAVSVGVLAFLDDGVPTANVELHDGGVWLTNQSTLMVGRLNPASQVLDAGLRTTGSNFDVMQQDAAIVIHDTARNTVSVVDPASVASAADVALPAESQVSMRDEVVAVADGSDGRVWAMPLRFLASFDPESIEPVATLGGVTDVAVGDDGVVYAVSAETGKFATIEVDDSGLATTVDSGTVDLPGEEGIDVTAVGSARLVWDSTEATLTLANGTAIELPQDSAIQQTSDSHGGISVATPNALVLYSMSGEELSKTAIDGAGRPAAPVYLNGCVYSAWAGSGVFLRDCEGEEYDVSVPIDGALPSAAFVFRVNRDTVVLNDYVNGTGWLASEGMEQVSNWDSLLPPPAEQKEQEELDEDEQLESLPDRSGPNTPPVAEDDSFGARAGRTTILPVIDNDYDLDGDVLGATVVDATAVPGDVQLIRGGAALQVVLSDDATGSFTFTYRADDGRGGVDDAKVSVKVTSGDENLPPESRRKSRLSLEVGATGTYNILPDFIDPEGDTLILTGAEGDGTDVVDFTPDGIISVTANPDVQGTRTITVQISDGKATVEGELQLKVLPAGSLAPLTNADHVVTVVDRPIVVTPLGNDISRSGKALRLAKVGETPGGVTTWDSLAGTITFSASRPGQYYIQYSATDDSQTSANLVRVDVLEDIETSLPPITVSDVALVAPGASTLVDVLANDVDPAGGVLVVQGVDVPAESGLAVAILEHRLVRVTNVSGITEPITLKYRASNGTMTSESEIVVMPIDAPAAAVAPVAHDDEVVVRAGDIATVSVLDNDESRAGTPFTIGGLSDPLVDPVVAEIFVSEEVVRIKAGDTPGQYAATYWIVDELGQRDAAIIKIKIMGPTDENSPPRPKDVTARVLGGNTARVAIPLNGIDPDGDSVELVGTDDAPQLGRIVQYGQDWMVYEAYPESQGTDHFTYVVRDRLGAEATGNVVVGVAPPEFVNNAPTAVRDEVSVRPERSVSFPVLVNDSDPDADLIMLEPEGLVVPEGITAEISGDRVLVHALEQGQYTILYTVTDVYGATAKATLLVNVDPNTPILPPIARDDRVAATDIADDGSVTVNVLDNDEDPDGVRSDLKVSVDPLAGAVNADGSVTLTAEAAARVVTYTVEDRDGETASAFIMVPGVGSQAPALVSEAAVDVTSGEPQTFDLAAYVVTASGRPAIITEVERVYAAHTNGDPLVVDEDTLAYTSADGYYGKDALTFQVIDGLTVDDPAGIRATLTLPLNVLPAGNVPPTIRNSSMEALAGGEPVTIDLAKLSTDPNPEDVATLKWSVGKGMPEGFRATVAGSVLSITVDADVAGATVEDVPVTVSDGEADPVEGLIRVTVRAAKPGENAESEDTVPAELPVAVDDKFADGKAGETAVVTVLANDFNPYGATAPLTIVDTSLESGAGGAGEGGITIQGDKVAITPSADFAGTMIVRYTIQDASGDESRRSSARIFVTVVKAPDAPQKPTVKAVEDSQVMLEWVEPPNNGSPITSYTVTSDQGTSDECTSTICTIDGLTNNVEYRFTVVAHNAVGASSPSPASDIARPDIHPDQPQAPTLTFGDRSLSVEWIPATTKGSPVRSYTLEISPAPPSGAQKANLTGTSYEWTGLENGVAYQVRIQALNDAVEPSTWSEYSSTEIPAGPPVQVAKPTTSRLTPVGNRAQIAVAWQVPSGNGDPVGSFTVNAVVGGTVAATQTVSGSTTSVPFELNPSSSDYTFTVVAHNKAGSSTVSTPSDPRRAFVAPGAPTGVTATPSDRAIVVGFTPGPLNGSDSAWISYEYELNGNGAWRAMPSNRTITGLSNGSSYTVKVRATTTADGASYVGANSSASGAAVPFGPIGNPSISISRGSGVVHFTVGAPGTNGRPITLIEYRYRAGSGAWSGWTNSGFTAGSFTADVSTGAAGVDAYIEVRVWAQDTPTAGTNSASGRSKDRSAWVSKGTRVNCSTGNASSSGGCNMVVVNWQELNATGYTVQCWDSNPTDGQLGTFNHSFTGSVSGSKELGCWYGFPGYDVWVNFISGPGAPFSTPRYTW